jgi:hypothetical protein
VPRNNNNNNNNKNNNKYCSLRSNEWVSGLCPSSGILNYQKEKLNVNVQLANKRGLKKYFTSVLIYVSQDPSSIHI